MKELLLIFTVVLLVPLTSVYPQTLMDYVSTVKGDTLVIKDFYEMNNQPNSLFYALFLDTIDVPAGRIYELKTNGYYPLATKPTTRRNTVIVGEDNTILVNNKNETSRPPLICGSSEEEGGISNTGGIFYMHDLTLKNCIVVPGSPDGALGRTFFDGQADNIKLSLQNCLLEQTRCVFMETRKQNNSWHIKDCYFVNMSNKFGGRSGGVLQIFAPQDTLWVENSTHVMAQGSLYRFWSYPFKRIIFNHNTIINCADLIFQDYGFQSAMSVTNNLFVNCNVKPYNGIDYTIDDDEEDIDHLPIGIVNLYPDTSLSVERKYLVCANATCWDPKLDDIVHNLNLYNINGSSNWMSQMFIMNDRTQAMFDDPFTYRNLFEGHWGYEFPNFTDSQGLMTTQVDNIRSYVIQIADTSITGHALPDWRIISTNTVFPDWPIPVDLSYDNKDLLYCAYGGFPVGDLNWFPAQKAKWLTQRNTEYSQILDFLDNGIPEVIIGIEEKHPTPFEFSLMQNYPNPFNPVTVISYTIGIDHLPASLAVGMDSKIPVTLKVYDILGKEVAILVNEDKAPGNYEINFDAGKYNLSSGIYFYKINAGEFTSTKKFILMK